MQKKLFHICLVSTVTSRLRILETSLQCVWKAESKNSNFYLLNSELWIKTTEESWVLSSVEGQNI